MSQPYSLLFLLISFFCFIIFLSSLGISLSLFSHIPPTQHVEAHVPEICRLLYSSSLLPIFPMLHKFQVIFLVTKRLSHQLDLSSGWSNLFSVAFYCSVIVVFIPNISISFSLSVFVIFSLLGCHTMNILSSLTGNEQTSNFQGWDTGNKPSSFVILLHQWRTILIALQKVLRI